MDLFVFERALGKSVLDKIIVLGLLDIQVVTESKSQRSSVEGKGRSQERI